VVLGDWKHYFIGERNGVKMEMSRHTAFKFNRTAFRASARLGGIPEEANAFVVLSDEVDATLS
jgi:HK97 family phage major capsid protein